MPDIKHFLVINAPANKVYEAITEQKGLAYWWTTNTIAKADLGFVDEFKFGGEYHNKMKVEKLENGKLVCWDCLDGDREWMGTKVSFELNEKNRNTKLMITHAGWTAQTLFYANCNFHWGTFMQSLKSYCETGGRQTI